MLLTYNTPFTNALSKLLLALRNKKTWLQINRVLAWALIVSPILQIMLRSDLANGLLLDLAILVVHAGLSLWLFGAPKVSSTSDTRWMRWSGVSYQGLTVRNRFLLSGWRVMLSFGMQAMLMLAVALVVMASPALARVPSEVMTVLIIAFWPFVLLSASFYGLMMPYAIVSHTFGASRYALRRWGLVDAQAELLASVLTALFIVISAANLFKTVWS